LDKFVFYGGLMSSTREKTVVEEALLEVELAMRYNSHQRAVTVLENVLKQFPSNTDVRWKLAEIFYQQDSPHTSAEQLFIIADIYIAANQLDFAESTLLKVKQVYPAAEFHVDTKLATLSQYQSLSQKQNQPTQPSQPTTVQNQVANYNQPYVEPYMDPYQNQNLYQYSYLDSYPNQPQQYQAPQPNQQYNLYYQETPYSEAYQTTYSEPNQTYVYETEELEHIDTLDPIELEPITVSQPVNNSLPYLAGDLHYINLFDVIQTLEKNEITGIVHIQSTQISGNLYLNRGLLADVICGELRGKAAFKCFAEITEGQFELEKSPVEFHQAIQIESNAKLILEIFSDDEDQPLEDDEPLENNNEQSLNW
jgi:hypothetical protein